MSGFSVESLDEYLYTDKEQIGRDAVLYSILCDYYWHTDTEELENGLVDTSDECRRFASKVMRYIETLIDGGMEEEKENESS